MEQVRHLWDLLGATGGSLALAFIVVLAAGLVALAALFVVAAVVVLERFARQARTLRSILAGGLVVTLVTTFVALQYWAPEVFEHARRLAGALPMGMAVSLGFVVVATGGMALALRFLSSRALAYLGAGLVLLGGLLVWGPPPIASLGLAARAGLATAGASAIALVAAAVLIGLTPLALAGFLDLRGSAEWFIAVRYLVAKRRQTFISVITGICIAGVAAGVWLIITVLSVMNGFERTWRDEIIGNRAHLTVQSGIGAFGDYESVLDRVLAQPGVVAASPYVQAEGMARGETGEIVGVRLQGIDPARVGEVTDLGRELVAGSLADLASPPVREAKPANPSTATQSAAPAPEAGPAPKGAAAARRPPAPGGAPPEPGIIVGDELAAALGVRVGDPLLLISPFGGPPTPLGASPRLMRFRVAGIFRSTLFQGDEVVTYTTIAAAQDFKRTGDVVDGIEVRTTDYYRSARIGAEVQQALGFPFYTRDWKEFFPAFFQALKTERIMMFVLLTMIMVVAAFAIVVTLIMMIMEKSSDIAILKAMGARDTAIERIFAIEGALIGLVGTVIGVVAGVAVTTRLDWIQHCVEDLFGIDALPASVYQGISELPAQLDAVQIAAVIGIAMALALGGTWIPSQQGARLDPVEALRYE